jgi:hypothetical protein
MWDLLPALFIVVLIEWIIFKWVDNYRRPSRVRFTVLIYCTILGCLCLLLFGYYHAILCVLIYQIVITLARLYSEGA